MELGPMEVVDELPAMPRPRRWYVWLLLKLTAWAMIAFSVWYFNYEPLFTILILFVLVVPFEKLFPRHEQKVRRPKLDTDISFALSRPVLDVFALVASVLVGILSLAWIPGLLIAPYVAMLSPTMKMVVGVLLFDMTVYWAHRWYHEVPLLWRFHAIHHSTEHLDWVSGFRGHPFDGTLAAPAFFFLLAAGFSPEFSGLLVILQVVLGLFLHANVRFRLAPLHRLIITPEFHHWHHTNEKEAHWSNYSTFLPIWDIIFGTYYMPKDKRPNVYGVDEYIPGDMVSMVFHPLRDWGHPKNLILHPFKSIAKGFRTMRTIFRGMRKSTFRARGHTPPLDGDP